MLLFSKQIKLTHGGNGLLKTAAWDIGGVIVHGGRGGRFHSTGNLIRPNPANQQPQPDSSDQARGGSNRVVLMSRVCCNRVDLKQIE